MPVTIKCPHCINTELVLKKDNKGPQGLLECPKCGCTFRVCLAMFNMKCYIKQYPKMMGAELKTKRGRPKKVVENE
jgi:transcription elongation factor Elf1